MFGLRTGEPEGIDMSRQPGVPFRAQAGPWVGVPGALLCLLGLLTGSASWAGAQQESPATPDSTPAWRPAPEVVAGVRRRVASRWAVPQEALRLEWGAPRDGQLPEGYTGAELLGSGRGGHWLVSFYRPDAPGRARSVTLRAGVVVRQKVARGGLERGQTLEASHIEERTRIHWGRPREFGETARVGWVAQRRIRPGEALAPPALRPPDLVVSGRPVRILWARNGVKVRMEGRAAGSGAMGEEVFVRTGTGERLRGVVRGPDTVVIQQGTREMRR